MSHVLAISGWRAFCAAGVLLGVAVWARPLLVQSMTLHMLVHIPLLTLVGVALGRAMHAWLQARHALTLPRRVARWLGDFNQFGVPGMLYATLVGMYWMIPKALDSVLLSPMAEASKVIAVVVAGLWLYDSWRRAHAVIKLFFVGGFCWTSAIAGMLYQESTARLCSFYLLNDQEWAGRGLVILAVVIPVGWLLAEVHAQRRHRRHTGSVSIDAQEQT